MHKEDEYFPESLIGLASWYSLKIHYSKYKNNYLILPLSLQLIKKLTMFNLLPKSQIIGCHIQAFHNLVYTYICENLDPILFKYIQKILCTFLEF